MDYSECLTCGYYYYYADDEPIGDHDHCLVCDGGPMIHFAKEEKVT
jgi:hypothetical protein